VVAAAAMIANLAVRKIIARDVIAVLRIIFSDRRDCEISGDRYGCR
jgi:hypothetical protein